MISYLSILLCIVGMFFVLTGTLGAIRLPGFFAKVHASGLTDAFGAPVLLLGLVLHYDFFLSSAKVFFIIIATWIGSTTATYAICKAKFKQDQNLEK